MIFRQITHDDLGCASYLIGDERAGVAAVVDPRFDVDAYLELADYLGVRIEHVLETHNHADHVSGHGRLAAATGATIHVHRAAEPDYDHEPFDDGWELALGSLTVRALHTPGHRPEHTAFALIDTTRGPELWAVLTGDTLFVGDIARPDLAIEKADGARGIFHSLHDKLLALPDTTEVWPGHLGGSMCGGPGMSLKVSSTIGYERAHNDLLAESDVERFVERSLANLGPQPPNFRAIVDLNRGPLLTDGVDAPALAPDQVEDLRERGALVVDARTDLQFDDAHVPGAICNPMHHAGFGSRLAWVAQPGQPIVLIGRDDPDGRAAVALAAAVGVRTVAGFLAGGMTGWRQEQRPAMQLERLDAGGLAERLAAEPDLQLIDVREAAEWNAGHIPGSRHVPYHDLRELPEWLDPERPIATICGSGQRACLAASLLLRLGARDVVHVADGGVPTYARQGHPLTVPEPAAG